MSERYQICTEGSTAVEDLEDSCKSPGRPGQGVLCHLEAAVKESTVREVLDLPCTLVTRSSLGGRAYLGL